MNFNTHFSKVAVLVIFMVTFISCDDDFNTIGGEIIDGQLDNLPSYEASFSAYNKRLEAVQTNNLPSYLLGIYNDPVYGQQTASILTQLSLTGANPQFGENVRLDSVILTLPYYNTSLEADEDGTPNYRLDSIFGNSAYKLTVSRSNYFLNQFDPATNFETNQRYFSDQGPLFESNLSPEPLYVNENFIPSNSEVVFFERNDENELDTTRVAPRLRANLDVDFFRENIINKQGSPELLSNNNFRNFIRGIYFKAEPINGNGNMILLDLQSNDANITLHYTNSVIDVNDRDEDGSTDDLVDAYGSYTLRFGDINVNTFSQEMPVQFIADINNQDQVLGAENLYLNGGAGSMAVIELFKDEAELQMLKDNDWLINEASLQLYVNQDIVPGGSHEPDRIYIYNLDTNLQLPDYSTAIAAAGPNPSSDEVALSLRTHLQPLERGEDENGIFYRIRITDHVNNILNNDANNPRLGLVVAQSSTLVQTLAIKNAEESVVKRVPATSIISPKGTVIYGPAAPSEQNRLKFNIFYTETNN